MSIEHNFVLKSQLLFYFTLPWKSHGERGEAWLPLERIFGFYLLDFYDRSLPTVSFSCIFFSKLSSEAELAPAPCRMRSIHSSNDHSLRCSLPVCRAVALKKSAALSLALDMIRPNIPVCGTGVGESELASCLLFRRRGWKGVFFVYFLTLPSGCTFMALPPTGS